MTQQVKIFSARGHDVLLEYDPATADMNEVNKTIKELEQRHGGKLASLKTAEILHQVTPESEDLVILQAIQGG